MDNNHFMYNVLIVPTLVQRRRVRVQEPDQFEEVDQHVEELPPMTQTQSKHGYISPVMMMPTFGMTYYGYNSEASPSSSNIGQQYYELGSDPSSSCMHGHGCGREEDNEYVYYEAPTTVPEQSDE